MDHFNWGRIALAIVAAAVAGSVTDWIFFGKLFHDKYLVYPEVWRKREGDGGAGQQIMFSSLIGAFSSALFIVLCAGTYISRYQGGLKLALAVWLIASVPLIANEHVFMKLHPAIFVSHSLGYLARFSLAAVAYMMFVSKAAII